MIDAIRAFVLLGMAAALFWLVLLAVARLAFRLLIRDQMRQPTGSEERRDSIGDRAAGICIDCLN